MEKKSTKRSKDRERRWTTGLERGQLQLPYNGVDVLLVDDTTMTLSQVDIHFYHNMIRVLCNTYSLCCNIRVI